MPVHVKPKHFWLPRKAGLTAEQIQMYSQERMMNFRFIARITATYSSRVLTANDLAPVAISMELSDLGQFAEAAYSTLPTEFIFDNINWLVETDFPLEGYSALPGTVLIAPIRGNLANLGAYIAYRPHTKQLVASISGTSNLSQAFQDVRTLHHKYRARPGCAVHTGFWKMYKGIRTELLDALVKGLREQEVSELVITGHSMGGALSYFVALDLLNSGRVDLPAGLPIKLAVFGAPRCGNEKLVQLWLDVAQEYRTKHGEDALKEFSVKAYNDGVPSLPPKYIGFRHFCQHPYYSTEGRLYITPPSEAEHSLFRVEEEGADEKGRQRLYPRGGHNYYNSRDMERVTRRMGWMEKLMRGADNEGWKDLYKAKVARRERGWVAETDGKQDGRQGL